MTALPRNFWTKVDNSGDCWLWTAGVTAKGYGKAFLNGRQVYAHRVAYENLIGPIPEGLMIDHRCREPRCVRPDHLQAVSNQANGQNRGAQKNSASGVRGVHPFEGRWRVQVKGSDGRRYSGGIFDDLADAARAAASLRNRVMENNLTDQ